MVEQGVWGTEVAQQGPGQSRGRDLGAKPLEAIGNIVPIKTGFCASSVCICC